MPLINSLRMNPSEQLQTLVLRSLINQIFDENLHIVRESPTNIVGFSGAMYCRGTIPHIRLVRTASQSDFVPQRRNKDVDAFVNSSTELVYEICILAHEFGHHFSTGPDAQLYDRLAQQRRLSPERVNADEGRAIFREEKRAWVNARKNLKRLGFQEWDAFKSQRSQGLSSYLVFLPPKCP